MLNNLTRSILSALLPPGSIWEPTPDGDFDLLLDGISENYEDIRIFLDSLADIREPARTIILEDLEKEFGIIDNGSLAEAQRRDRLAAAKYIKNSDGSSDTLQARLQRAGFNVLVHINDPPVDPSDFVGANFKTVCGNASAICGGIGVICGTANSNQLLVNGDLIFHNTAIQQIVCGNANSICNSIDAVCGKFIPNPDSNDVTYVLPPSPDYDHLIFFVGGTATRDGVTGEILTIAPAQVQASRRDEFEAIILDYKVIQINPYIFQKSFPQILILFLLKYYDQYHQVY